MEGAMKRTFARWAMTALAVLGAITGCGGGSDAPSQPPAQTPQTAQQAIAAAAASSANDSASNSAAPFTVLQAAGVPAVTVQSAPKVNFTVFSDGAVKTGLALSNVSLVMAKLVPGTNGDPDQWVNYVYRTEVR
jgi:hypothetical protein